MAQNLFLKSDEMGKEIRDKREADKQQQQQAQDAAGEQLKSEAQHKENKKQGMI